MDTPAHRHTRHRHAGSVHDGGAELSGAAADALGLCGSGACWWEGVDVISTSTATLAKGEDSVPISAVVGNVVPAAAASVGLVEMGACPSVEGRVEMRASTSAEALVDPFFCGCVVERSP